MIHRVQRFVPPRLRAVGVEVNGSNGCVTRLLTRAAIPWGDRKAAISTAQPDSSAPPPGGTARHRFALPQRMPILTIQLYRLKAEYWVGAQSWVGARSMPLGAASVGAAAPR